MITKSSPLVCPLPFPPLVLPLPVLSIPDFSFPEFSVPGILSSSKLLDEWDPASLSGRFSSPKMSKPGKNKSHPSVESRQFKIQISNRDLFRTNLATKSLFCYRSDNKKQNMQLKQMKPKKIWGKTRLTLGARLAMMIVRKVCVNLRHLLWHGIFD